MGIGMARSHQGVEAVIDIRGNTEHAQGRAVTHALELSGQKLLPGDLVTGKGVLGGEDKNEWMLHGPEALPLQHSGRVERSSPISRSRRD